MITHIIKVKNFETRCDCCGTRFCFELEDFENNKEADNIYSSEATNQYVICPICGKHNTVRRTFGGDDRYQLTDNVAINWMEKEDIEINGIFKCPIKNLEMTIRTKNCLLNWGIETVGQLVKLTAIDVQHIRNMGHKSFAEILEVLGFEDLRLGMTDYDILEYSRNKDR